MTTTEELSTALEIMVAAVDSIRELKRVPSGFLYAAMMSKMSLPAFESMVRQIVRTGLVREEKRVLIWVGDES